jgi:hypothetical protein
MIEDCQMAWTIEDEDEDEQYQDHSMSKARVSWLNTFLVAQPMDRAEPALTSGGRCPGGKIAEPAFANSAPVFSIGQDLPVEYIPGYKVVEEIKQKKN